jgi:RNA-directed DNA polymerase
MNMHADENSDGVIVPEKRSNKEGLPSAEAVEGRTPPKGNGGETAAARTLRRDTASNGLIAVRRAARQSKRVRNVTLTQRRSLWVGNLWERANCEKRTLAIAA